jgi:small subunit ribosomal protein S16
MVSVRLARFGSKKRPYYHVVVTHSENPRDGRFIEQIGTYDPTKPMADARIDRTRLDYWLGVGARPSVTLAKVLREHKKALDAVAVKS